MTKLRIWQSLEKPALGESMQPQNLNEERTLSKIGEVCGFACQEVRLLVDAMSKARDAKSRLGGVVGLAERQQAGASSHDTEENLALVNELAGILADLEGVAKKKAFPAGDRASERDSVKAQSMSGSYSQ